MEPNKDLMLYIRQKSYRESLGLPGEITEEYRMLAQGEYNRNYTFDHPITGKKLVLRINYGSQMHLEHQIEYEYHALELLKVSGRTPAPVYVDGSQECIPHGVMVMEYLPGHALDYGSELLRAAECLADIHSIRIPDNHHLIVPKYPLNEILEECDEMFAVYESSRLADGQTLDKIKELLKTVREKEGMFLDVPYRCCINTELNSTNFLMNGPGGNDYLIDWEKPLYGDPAQDLGHFLAPTTTFWKTDVILDRRSMDAFIEAYQRRAAGRFDTTGIRERTNVYMQTNCLRGLTWCAMAVIEYQNPDKAIFNQSTYDKLKAYLSDEFLEQIRQFISN